MSSYAVRARGIVGPLLVVCGPVFAVGGGFLTLHALSALGGVGDGRSDPVGLTFGLVGLVAVPLGVLATVVGTGYVCRFRPLLVITGTGVEIPALWPWPTGRRRTLAWRQIAGVRASPWQIRSEGGRARTLHWLVFTPAPGTIADRKAPTRLERVRGDLS